MVGALFLLGKQPKNCLKDFWVLVGDGFANGKSHETEGVTQRAPTGGRLCWHLANQILSVSSPEQLHLSVSLDFGIGSFGN
jgi:hypothetical protein